MIRDYIYDWYIKWHFDKYGYKIKDKDHIPCEVKPPYSKIEYKKDFRQPFVNEWRIILGLSYYYSEKYPFLKKLLTYIDNFCTKCFIKLERYWIKKNNLMDRVDKCEFEVIMPYIKNDIESLSKEDLIGYAYLAEKYTKEQIDALGFGPPPNRKIGFFKKLWYKLTFTVY